ncbi:MAG: signal recognition particle protein [Gammaproteobacteria bacterium]|nr:signal recognition particle protein [Gammaproteobacteria bacterium]
MFSNLSEKFGNTIRNLSGRGRLTEENIQEALREIRMALIDADVALSVVKQFIEDIKEAVVGQEIVKSIRPGDMLVKLVQDELTKIMGDSAAEINLNCEPPAVILMAGLQGSGKTTTVAKLANLLKIKKKKSVLVVSADVYRPAAIKQLETLAGQIDVNYFPSDAKQKPVKIAEDAVKYAKRKFIDIVIVDTAGRMHVDSDMMNEIYEIFSAVNPVETLFVVDSMTGQDAANTAKAFNDVLPLTGVVLTKVDGDARGGAALSVKMITGKPIKYVGLGEKIDALEVFYPERMASRILGMGDIVGLVEEAQENVDQKKAKKLAKKISKGKGFDLEDFLDQLQQLRNMGGIQNMLGKLPGMGVLPKAAKSMVNDKLFHQMEAMINSMTKKERRYPALIKGSRKRRIAMGSGTEVQDVNRLLKQFTQMQKMMKRMKGGGMMRMMKNLQHMQ